MVDDAGNLVIEHFLVGPIRTNIYLIGCAESGSGAIVDAGGQTEAVLERAETLGLEVDKIVQTHAHVDHVGGLSEMKARTGAPIHLHRDELEMYEAAPRQGAMFGIDIDPLPEPDVFVQSGDEIEVGRSQARVLHLPGHSPGGIGFYFEKEGVIFSGDVLFAGSIGRVDLPGADPDVMRESLETLKKLPDETRVLSGHGPETTIGDEKRRNPYL